MSSRFDESLLDSPLPDPARRRRWPVAVIISAVVVAAGIGGTWVVSGSDDGATTENELITAVSTTGARTVPGSTPSGLTLGEYSPAPALLYYPTVLPDGWELCRGLEDISQGDRFCDPDSDDMVWVQVALKDAGTVRSDQGVATGDPYGGRWLDGTDKHTVVYSAGQFLVLVVSTVDDGLGPEALLEVAGSIPLVVDRNGLYGEYEIPLDLQEVTDEQLAKLVESVGSDPRVVANRDGGEAQVFLENGSLMLFYGDGFTTPDFGPAVPLPRLIDEDRPVVVGESRSRGRSFAVWDQRGFGWRLEINGTADTATQLARDIIQQIAGFD